jgi:hypothetical protein
MNTEELLTLIGLKEVLLLQAQGQITQLQAAHDHLQNRVSELEAAAAARPQRRRRPAE